MGKAVVIAPGFDPVSRSWATLVAEARETATREPFLAATLQSVILAQDGLVGALTQVLAAKLCDVNAPPPAVAALLRDNLGRSRTTMALTCRDLTAYFERDSACTNLLYPFLFYKGFHATQGYRVMHSLWQQGQTATAHWVQNRVSEVLGVDIHPGARIGSGLMIDHGTGIVIGETTIIEDDVSIMQNVTLGGTGKEGGDRHPVIRRGALISSGAKVLGRIEIGEGAKVGAGSVVLGPVPAHSTAVGVPAKIVGRPRDDLPSYTMQHDVTQDMTKR